MLSGVTSTRKGTLGSPCSETEIGLPDVSRVDVNWLSVEELA